MLPGIGALTGRIGRVAPFTRFYGSGSVTVPAFRTARFSLIGTGGTGRYSSDYNGQGQDTSTGGGGGAFSQSILAVTPGEVLGLWVDAASTRVQRGSTILVSAQAGSAARGANSIPGRAENGVGTVRYSGGAGPFVTGRYATGGGAAGSTGNASASSRGPGQSWTQTSDRAVATNGSAGARYGGGGSVFDAVEEAGQPGIIIIEWGFEQ